MQIEPIDPISVLKEIAEDCERRLRKGPDNGDALTLRKCREAIEAGISPAPLLADLPALLRFPSSDYGYDIQAFIPVGMSFDEALKLANDAIFWVNKEDDDSDGEGCLDGLEVQGSIQRRLTQIGFRFIKAEAQTTREWDSFDSEPPSSRERG